MNNEEKEQTKLNKLLQECIEEQNNIGLRPINGVKAYFKEPITKTKCPQKLGATTAHIEGSDDIFILVNENFFKLMPSKYKKALLHHELIHCILNKNDEPISHMDDWQEFSEISNKIYEVYGFRPIDTYTPDCFSGENKTIEYTDYSSCPRCGHVSYYNFKKRSRYKTRDKCPNCGYELEKKRLTHLY